jgi:hypothetical protein
VVPAKAGNPAALCAVQEPLLVAAAEADARQAAEGERVMSPDPERRDGWSAAALGLSREQEHLVEATVGRCLGLIAHAVGREPQRPLLSLLIGHTVYATVLGVVAEEASPAVREHLAREAAEAIARAVREAAP